MRNAPHRPSLFAILIFLGATTGISASADREPIVEALQWVRAPLKRTLQYDYIMSARVHLIFFWAGKDDVGGGYIRRAVSSADPHAEFFQVLFGSDPEKAPRAINRWGAGTEVDWHRNPVTETPREDDITASAFFGFMKSSRGKSVAEMQSELKREAERGQHSFTGILSRVEPARAVSTIVPLQSDMDFTLRQYDLAEPLMLERIEGSEHPVRALAAGGGCDREGSFLATVTELVDTSLDGTPPPQSRCYVHDAQENTLTLEKVTPLRNLVAQLHGPKDVVILDTAYRDLLQLDFVSTHKETGKKVYFTIFVGTQGALRGVPVQIRYQPNWWFQVVLNLRPSKSPASESTAASR